MQRWRQFALALAVCAASLLSLAAVMQFLAPGLSYQVRDRIGESLSGNGGRKYRIALGVATGSYFHLGTVLNRYLKEKSGYELELVATTGVPENVGALLDPARQIHLATIESSSEEGARAEDLHGLAMVGRQYFFVIVPNESAVQDVRDLAGPVNPGSREPGQAPTLGERVLAYYGLLAPPQGSAMAPRVSVVRPSGQSMSADFDAGRMVAATRTQFVHSDLIEGVLRTGRHRLVPIRDHVALAGSLPGTEPGIIPAGAYGPDRRIPSEPVPTLAVASLLVARSDLPGRVARDILEVIYDPRFARDIQFDLTEAAGQKVGVLPLHPAAEVYYHRNDLLTSDRIGRLTFVAWLVGAAVAVTQFIASIRRGERRKARRQLLGSELEKLRAIRQRIEDATDAAEARALIVDADDLLCRAEQDAAADLLDAEGIASLRSLHGICWRALQHRLGVRLDAVM